MKQEKPFNIKIRYYSVTVKTSNKTKHKMKQLGLKQLIKSLSKSYIVYEIQER